MKKIMVKAMKSVASISLAVIFLAGSASVAGAQEALTESKLMPPSYLRGEIVYEKGNSIEVHSEMQDRSVILHITEDTFIADAESGEPTTLRERTGDEVIVYYGPAETRSIPPQSSAVAILCNVPDTLLTAHYGVAESVEESDNGIKVTSDGGSIIITVPKETPITFFLSGKEASVEDIQTGREMLFWYAMVAMSYPGQTTATKAVILESNAPGESDGAEEKEDATETSGDESVIDEALFAGWDYTREGVRMVPLRIISEAYGYSVDWDDAAKSVSVANETENYLLFIGRNQYGEARLEAAPEIKDSRAYVPLSFFEEMLNI